MNTQRAYKLGFIQGLAAGIHSVADLTQALQQQDAETELQPPPPRDAPLPPGTESTGRFFNEFHRVGGPTGSYVLDQALPADTSV